jgi:hypothetical protein
MRSAMPWTFHLVSNISMLRDGNSNRGHQILWLDSASICDQLKSPLELSPTGLHAGERPSIVRVRDEIPW